MTPSELKNKLSEKYELICFEDLAVVLQDQKNLYSILQKYHQTAYNPEQKLVFYSQYQPSRTQLCNFQSAAALIDISNFFILMCCPYDLTDDLLYANNLHGYDQTVINNTVCELEGTNVLTSDSVVLDTMCPLPWTHLEIMPRGHVSPCCVSSLILGKVEDLHSKKLFHSDEMQNLRDQLLRGEKSPSCDYCWKRESHNQVSHRQRQLSLYQKDLMSQWIYDPKIRSLDLRLGNTCNFKCRICHVEHSSLRISEELKFAETFEIKQAIKQKQIVEQNAWFDNIEKFLQDLDSTWPDLLNIDIIGGEPFVLKNLPDILDHIINLGHANHIRLHITTNGSVFPKNLISRLSQFRFIDISISIDNTGDKFELERGGSWPNVVNNVQQFLTLDKEKFNVCAYCTVNIQNVLDLDDLFQWAESMGINLLLNILEQPNYLSIDQLTDDGKKLVIEKYQNSTRPQLNSIVKQIENSVSSDGQRFVAEMKQFDQRRQQDFLLTHRTIANAMGLQYNAG